MGAFYRQVTLDEDVASRLAVATHELLENAVKSSSDGAANRFIQFDPSSRAVDVKVSNRASDTQIALLRARFGEIGDAADAQRHYEVLLKRSAVVDTGRGGSAWRGSGQRAKSSWGPRSRGDTVEIHAHGSVTQNGTASEESEEQRQ